MTEGETKKCGQCGIEIIHVKIIDTYENRNTEKLQWQTNSTRKPHFKFAGEGKWKCITTEEIVQESMDGHNKSDQAETIKKHLENIVFDGPFQQAELITKWAADKATKIATENVGDLSKLTQQEKSSLGQKTGMLTRLLADLTMELIKEERIKSGLKHD